ncbi:MAG TPA: oxidoreductase [Streptosporangiaceae bacterium]|jgi:NAD(P)-dependent dehydrogenase (short-subunit alcohol dehydrogenase family)|nr:oxidoreductase [Streptosporangiaceae bacterium]
MTGTSRATADTAKPWVEADVPDQTGRTAVVTGANTGLGFEAARVLAERGADVILACRTPARAQTAVERIRASAKGQVSTVRVDLASKASIAEAAEELNRSHERIDLLLNNAGLMMPPYGRTEDGFELQFGTNHLGHFALTGLLLGRMLPVPGSRVVTMSSNGHRMGRIDFGNLQWEHGYSRTASYGRSKLANLLFTYELQRRLAAAGAQTAALAAHPGTSRSELTRYLPLWMRILSVVVPTQSAAAGAVPMLRAATDPAASGGEYYGPAGFGEMTGPAKRVRSSARSHDEAVAKRLWEESERLTGVTYPL